MWVSIMKLLKDTRETNMYTKEKEKRYYLNLGEGD